MRDASGGGLSGRRAGRTDPRGIALHPSVSRTDFPHDVPDSGVAADDLADHIRLVIEIDLRMGAQSGHDTAHIDHAVYHAYVHLTQVDAATAQFMLNRARLSCIFHSHDDELLLSAVRNANDAEKTLQCLLKQTSAGEE